MTDQPPISKCIDTESNRAGDSLQISYSSGMSPLWLPPTPAYFPRRYSVSRSLYAATPIIVVELIALAIMITSFQKSAGLCAAALMVGVLVTYWLLRTGAQLRMDPNNIIFPFIFSAALRGQLTRYWKDVTGIEVDSHGQANPYHVRCTFLTMRFVDGACARVRLSNVQPEELATLRNAVAQWCPVSHPRIGDLAAVSEFEREQLQTFALSEFNKVNEKFELGAYERAQPRDTIGPYRVGKLLATSRVSSLYRVESASRTRTRLKEVFIPDDCHDKEGLKSALIKCADSLASIRQPGLCSILDAFVEGDRFCYVLEEADGPSLRALKSWSLLDLHPVYPQADIARALAELVAQLHEQAPPIVHGSLHPGLFTLGTRHPIILTDFGFTDVLLSAYTGNIIGDISYKAPEVLSGPPTIKSDIYALGCTLYFLYAAKDPRPLCSSNLALQQDKIDPDFVNLVQSCTALSCDERPDSAREVSARLSMVPDLLTHDCVRAGSNDWIS